jgi:hypothetical protein
MFQNTRQHTSAQTMKKENQYFGGDEIIFEMMVSQWSQVIVLKIVDINMEPQAK